jgi:hypothetical protein
MGDDSDGDSDSDGESDGGGDARKSDVRLDTFNEKFMSMNLDKIIHKIRDLYKESYFYKKTGPNGIIAHVNATRPYPTAQINLALTQMVSEPNEYITDKYGRLGRLVNVGVYYLFQPIELNDKRASIHDRSVPIPYKHETVEYPLPLEVSDNYFEIKQASASSSRPTGSSETPVTAATSAKVQLPTSNEEVAAAVKKMLPASADAAVATSSAAAAASDVVALAPVGQGGDIQELIGTLQETFETCRVVHEKPTKTQDEWYYYCGKVIEQISQTDEFHITREQLYELVVANLLEHLFIGDSIKLINYLYHKNNDSMVITRRGEVGGIQPLSQFEQMLLNYYSQQIIHRVLGGKRAAAAAAAASTASAATRPPEDAGMLLFHEKKDQFELIVLRYETPEWVVAEPEDMRDFTLLLGKLQTTQIQTMNMIVGFISFFKREYLIFKVKMMKKKRDKGARCDQSGKTDTITMINSILMLGPETQGEEYKLTIENTKHRTQKELCVFQEFLLRTFQYNNVNGKKWFFTPGEALLCNIEKLHMEE